MCSLSGPLLLHLSRPCPFLVCPDHPASPSPVGPPPTRSRLPPPSSVAAPPWMRRRPSLFPIRCVPITVPIPCVLGRDSRLRDRPWTRQRRSSVRTTDRMNNHPMALSEPSISLAGDGRTSTRASPIQPPDGTLPCLCPKNLSEPSIYLVISLNPQYLGLSPSVELHPSRSPKGTSPSTPRPSSRWFPMCSNSRDNEQDAICGGEARADDEQ